MLLAKKIQQSMAFLLCISMCALISIATVYADERDRPRIDLQLSDISAAAIDDQTVWIRLTEEGREKLRSETLRKRGSTVDLYVHSVHAMTVTLSTAIDSGVIAIEAVDAKLVEALSRFLDRPR